MRSDRRAGAQLAQRTDRDDRDGDRAKHDGIARRDLVDDVREQLAGGQRERDPRPRLRASKTAIRPRTTRRTLAAPAPIAIRMPISRRRRDTA